MSNIRMTHPGVSGYAVADLAAFTNLWSGLGWVNIGPDDPSTGGVATGGFAPAWVATTAYAVGQVAISPGGGLIVRKTAGTSRASYDATEKAAWRDSDAAYKPLRQNEASVVFLGSSWTANGIDSNGDHDDMGWWVWFQAFSGQRLTLLNAAGVTGQRIDEFTARVSTDVTPYAPGWVFVDGPTNDITQDYSLATIKTNFLALLAALAPARVVAYTVAPNNTNTNARNAVKDGYNDWLRQLPGSAQAEALGVHLYVVEVHDVLISASSSTAQFAAGMSGDGTHLTPDGALLMGKVMSDTLTPILPGGIGSRLSAGADSLNLLGTSGSFVTPTAGLAAGWTNTTAGTSTPTTAARTDNIQGNLQQVVIPNGTTTTQLYQRPAGYSIGDTVFGHAELYVDALGDGAAAFPYYALRVTMLGAAGTPSAWALSSRDGTTRRSTLPGAKLTLKTRPIVVPTGTTNVQIGLIMSGGGTFRWGRAGLRKV